MSLFFFQAEDGIRYLVRSRGLGDVYKRQTPAGATTAAWTRTSTDGVNWTEWAQTAGAAVTSPCLLYTSDAADERSSVDLGGRRIIKKKKQSSMSTCQQTHSRTCRRRAQHDHVASSTLKRTAN